MSEQVEQPACERCRFWVRRRKDIPWPLPDIEDGFCKRHAPVAAPHDWGGEILGWPVFPVTRESDWCGEFQPKAKG